MYEHNYDMPLEMYEHNYDMPLEMYEHNYDMPLEMMVLNVILTSQHVSIYHDTIWTMHVALCVIIKYVLFW